MIMNFRESLPSISFLEMFTSWQQVNPSYQDWDTEDQFSIFYQQYRQEKTPFEIQCEMAYQLYEMQSCLEGIIEDMEVT